MKKIMVSLDMNYFRAQHPFAFFTSSMLVFAENLFLLVCFIIVVVRLMRFLSWRIGGKEVEGTLEETKVTYQKIDNNGFVSKTEYEHSFLVEYEGQSFHVNTVEKVKGNAESSKKPGSVELFLFKKNSFEAQQISTLKKELLKSLIVFSISAVIIIGFRIITALLLL